VDKILVIPRYLVFVKFIDVPSLREPEIEKMAGFQALKEIPHPSEDLVISYRNLGSFKEGFSSLLLCLADKDMIQERISVRQRSNIETESIRLYSELLYLFLLKQGTVNKDKVSFLLYVGREDSEILIIDKGRPIFSRGFKNSENFLDEIDRSVLAYKRIKDNPVIEDIIVTYPSDVDIENARPHIEGHFTMPVSFYEYSEDLAAVDVAAEIDLIPKEITRNKTALQKKKELIVTCSLLGLTVILFSGLFYYKIYEKSAVLDKHSERKSEVASRIQGLETLRKKTEIVKKHIEHGGFIARVLERSYIMIPDDVSIKGLDYDGGDSIFYKGTSENMSSVFSFVRKLEGAGYFDKVEVKHATKRKSKGKEFTDFNIQCRLKL